MTARLRLNPANPELDYPETPTMHEPKSLVLVVVITKDQENSKYDLTTSPKKFK